MAKIIQDVQTRGDAALYDLTQKHDNLDCRATGFAIPTETIARHIATIPPDQREALELAATRIRAYHETQRPTDAWWQDDTGAHLGWRWSAIDRAGLYVPGGAGGLSVLSFDERHPCESRGGVAPDYVRANAEWSRQSPCFTRRATGTN